MNGVQVNQILIDLLIHQRTTHNKKKNRNKNSTTNNNNNNNNRNKNNTTSTTTSTTTSSLPSSIHNDDGVDDDDGVVIYENLISLSIQKLYLSDAYDLSNLFLLTPRLEELSLQCNLFNHYLFHIIRGKVYRSLKKLMIENSSFTNDEEHTPSLNVVSPSFHQLEYISLTRVDNSNIIVECLESVSNNYNMNNYNNCNMNNYHNMNYISHGDSFHQSSSLASSSMTHFINPSSILSNQMSYHSLHTCQLIQCKLPNKITFLPSLQYLEIIDCIGMHEMNISESMKYLSQNLKTLIVHANCKIFKLQDDDVTFMLKEFHCLEFLDIKGHTLLDGKFFISLCHALHLEYLCIEHLISNNSLQETSDIDTFVNVDQDSFISTRNMPLIDFLEQVLSETNGLPSYKNHSIKHLFIYGDK